MAISNEQKQYRQQLVDKVADAVLDVHRLEQELEAARMRQAKAIIEVKRLDEIEQRDQQD